MDLKVERVIEEYVQRCERKYGQHDQKKYIPYVRTMGSIKLADVPKEGVDVVVQPFLYKWGRMGRTLGRQEYGGWQEKTASLVRSNADRLRHFRQSDLSRPHLDLAAHESDIKDMYSSFTHILGRIASTKILHLICPDFFPPWDNPIAAAYRTAVSERDPKTQKIKYFSPEDYYRFVHEVRALLLRHDRLLSCLAAKYRKSKVRILDECLWFAAKENAMDFFLKIWSMTANRQVALDR